MKLLFYVQRTEIKEQLTHMIYLQQLHLTQHICTDQQLYYHRSMLVNNITKLIRFHDKMIKIFQEFMLSIYFRIFKIITNR